MSDSRPSASPKPMSELTADIRETRAHVAADLEALKEQLTVDKLKERAIEVAERSVEGLALKAARSLLQGSTQLFGAARRNPARVLAITAGLGLLVWQVRARRAASRRQWM